MVAFLCLWVSFSPGKGLTYKNHDFKRIIDQKIIFKNSDGARLREELADKEAELTAALAKSRDLSQELAATGGQLRQQLAAKTEALAASAKELDSLKRSLGEIICDSADPF
jgi:hypothetical protein